TKAIPNWCSSIRRCLVCFLFSVVRATVFLAPCRYTKRLHLRKAGKQICALCSHKNSEINFSLRRKFHYACEYVSIICVLSTVQVRDTELNPALDDFCAIGDAEQPAEARRLGRTETLLDSPNELLLT